MQPFALFKQDKSGTHGERRHQSEQSGEETYQAVGKDKAENGPADSSDRPIDVPSLKSHQFKRPLKPLEQWVPRVAAVVRLGSHAPLSGDTEKQRKCLCSSYQEDTSSYNHHDRLFQNLLPNCKVLNINTPKKQKVPKETNWKQKFQKPQNENICLIYLNTEMNGNFHFLSFCAAFLKVQNQVL